MIIDGKELARKTREKLKIECDNLKKGRYRDMTKINENYKKLGIDVSKI